MTDEDSESGMPLERPDKPRAPTLLPPKLMKEWDERRKEEQNKEGNNTNSDSEAPESEFPSPAEVTAELTKSDPPQGQSTEAAPAEAEKSSGVPANRKR